MHDFKEVIPLSALKKEGLDMLLDAIVQGSAGGAAYFPEDQITDQPARFMAAEIIREQVLLDTKEEVPYATTVMVEQFEEGREAHADCGDDLLRARRAEGHPGGKRRADAEENRHCRPTKH